MTLHDGARRRGRPRDPTIDARVLGAAVEELAERGIGAFSVNSVAARAGVDKRGIYARWPKREALIVEALGTLAAGLSPPLAGSLRGDLEAMLPAVAAVFATPRRQILARCIDETRAHPEIYDAFRRDSVDRCIAVVEDAFWSARRRRELVDAVAPAQAAEAFVGLILARATLRGDDAILSDAEQRAIVDFTMTTLATGARR